MPRPDYSSIITPEIAGSGTSLPGSYASPFGFALGKLRTAMTYWAAFSFFVEPRCNRGMLNYPNCIISSSA